MSKETTYLHARKKGYSVVEHPMLDDAELTLQAKGLLMQLCSHRDGWKIRMSDIIKRSKNGRDSHYNIMKELIRQKYVARLYVKLNGRHRELIYIFGQEKEDVEELLNETRELKISEGFNCLTEYGSLFADLKAEYLEENSSDDVSENPSENTSEVPERPLPRNQKVEENRSESSENASETPIFSLSENQEATSQDIRKEQLRKEQYKNIKDKNIDDDKRTLPSEDSTASNDESLNLVINELFEATKDELNKRSFKSVLRKVMDKYKQGKVQNFRDYFVTSLVNKVEDLELRRIKEHAKSALKDSAEKRTKAMIKEQIENNTPIDTSYQDYNWLDE